MKKRAIRYILTVCILALWVSVSLAAIPVKLTVGRGTVLTLEKTSKRVSIANPDLAELTMISPMEMLLTGKRAGATNLIVWDEKEKATVFNLVVSGDTGALAAQIKEMAPNEAIEVETAEDSIVLRGTARNKDTIDNVHKLAQAYSPKVINFLRVLEPEQVLLEVRVAQVDREKLSQFGLGFLAKGIDGDVAELTFPGLFAHPGGNVGGDAGLAMLPGLTNFDVSGIQPQVGVAHFPGDIAAVLRALAAKKLATILAEPNLVVRNGEKGSFLAGSRVPVQQVTGVGAAQTVSIVYEEVGVKLNFAPQVLEDGTIRLTIDPAEVSTLGPEFLFGSITAPRIDTREVRTSVDLREGESLILAGLLSEEMKKNIQKIPLLGDIPILGAIFRSTKEELKRTEVAFFITPRLVKPLPPGARPELPGERLSDKEKREYWWAPVPGGSNEPEGGEPEKKETAK